MGQTIIFLRCQRFLEDLVHEGAHINPCPQTLLLWGEFSPCVLNPLMLLIYLKVCCLCLDMSPSPFQVHFQAFRINTLFRLSIIVIDSPSEHRPQFPVSVSILEVMSMSRDQWPRKTISWEERLPRVLSSSQLASRFKLATGFGIQSQFQLNSYLMGSNFVPDIVLCMVRNEEG